MDSPNVYIYVAVLTEQQPFLGKYLAMLYGNFIVVFERAQIHLPRRLVPTRSLRRLDSHFCSTHLHYTGSQINTAFTVYLFEEI